MKKFDNLLFDLDGTISDSAPGLKIAINYALEAFGQKMTEEELDKYIGPPLEWSFKEYNHLNDEEVKLAIKRFHDVYDVKEMYNNYLYPGIKELLIWLNENGYNVYAATSKPETIAKRVLEYFEITQYFKGIYGADSNRNRLKKDEVIKYLFDECNIDLEKTLMIGDRKYDIIGAHDNGIKALGVLYGYGSREEFGEAGADFISETVDGIREFI